MNMKFGTAHNNASRPEYDDRASIRRISRRLRPIVAKTSVRSINLAGPLLRKSRRLRFDFEADQLIEAATSRTGLKDFGGEPFRVPLEVLLQAYEREARLNFVGRVTTWWDTVRLLSNLLHVVDDRKHFPGIAAEGIHAPVFIMGLPRTGSTFLHALLAQDPQNHSPAHWEIMHPSPPPAGISVDNPRVARTASELAWMNWLVPELPTAHTMAATDPQECTEILSNVFMSLRFDSTYEVPSYLRWIDHHGLYAAYAFHRRFLQQLQYSEPVTRRWVLKSPDHVFALNEILRTYPDARIVMTHRAPLEVLPSVASLTVMLESAFSDAADPVRIGERVTARWADGARRIVAAAESDSSQGRIVHIFYSDLSRFPLNEVRRIYRHFDLELTAEAETLMTHFTAVHPTKEYGEHHYSLAQFGLDPEQLQWRFGPYLKYFGLNDVTS